MKIIWNNSTDPYFNIAAEEYLFKNSVDDIFLLYRNEPSIIVGKHQNTLSEINLEFVIDNELKVVRRLSGGGAVFHDLGNINFTFITNSLDEKKVDFHKFTLPIIEVLQKLGVPAEFGTRNEIIVYDKKVSGNAEHVHKNRVLHHGTLLFSTQLANLKNALLVKYDKYTDKSVKSVRSKVSNICEFFLQPMDVLIFIKLILEYISLKYKDSQPYEFNHADKRKIQELANNKYTQWEWNFGYSPKYVFNNKLETNEGPIECELEVQSGIIQRAKFNGIFFDNSDKKRLELLLLNQKHDFLILSELIFNNEDSPYFNKTGKIEILKVLF